MPQIVSETNDVIVIEDDGGFINVIQKQKPPKVLTPKEREELEKKLNDLEIYMF